MVQGNEKEKKKRMEFVYFKRNQNTMSLLY